MDNVKNTAATATSTAYELFLIRLRYKDSEQIAVGGNKPFLLNDPNRVWFVLSGKLDVFSVRVEDNNAQGARTHLFRVEENQAVFGMNLEKHTIGMLVSAFPQTELLSFTLPKLIELSENAQFADIVKGLLNKWLEKLSETLTGKIVPKNYKGIEPGKATTFSDHTIVRSKKETLWIKHLEGTSTYIGDSTLTVDSNTIFPLSPQGWIQTNGTISVQAYDTAAYFKQDTNWSSLYAFHDMFLRSVENRAQQSVQVEQNRLQNKLDANRAQVESAFTRLASTLGDAGDVGFVDTDSQDALLIACQLVGNSIGVPIKPGSAWNSSASKSEKLSVITNASRVRTRQVALRGDWWLVDNGPLIAYWEDNKQPVALLPTSSRSYEYYDPVEKIRKPVDAEVANKFNPFAEMFYRPFPSRALTAFDLLKFGLRGSRDDLLRVFMVGIVGGILGMAVPIVTGILFDAVIPGADQSQLLLITLVLIVIGISSAILQITRSLALLRVEGRMDVSIQAAVWDRVLGLPPTFFRDYSAGDLSTRVMGVTTIRRIIFSTILSSVLAAIFSVFSLFLLFAYDGGLALMAVGLVLVSALFTIGTGLLQVRHQRELTELQGKISGMVFQFIGGMSKFRVAGAEDRAFAQWATEFSQQRRIAFRVESIRNYLNIFNTIYPVLTSMIIFAVIASGIGLTTGAFLAFTAAFNQFLGSILQLSNAAISIISLLPVYERAKPILNTLPEVSETKSDPGELTGSIEVNHVSFRYREDAPYVLRDISLQIKPGEFVAIVGASGGGKSTLFRLLLGFELPSSGGIYYDDKDLSELDIQAVRRQLGVVLQNGRIMSGDIFRNIVGNNVSLTIDDAWEAARMAGFDVDIQAMPMGMHTVISEGAGNLSGGQRQRLLIARAIVNKPRIIFFDEATSALDNRTQAVVSESLERLDATRIVIAHRLSTIINADKIFVLDGGRVVQTGNYAELIKQPGLFADLARRQLV